MGASIWSNVLAIMLLQHGTGPRSRIATGNCVLQHLGTITCAQTNIQVGQPLFAPPQAKPTSSPFGVSVLLLHSDLPNSEVSSESERRQKKIHLRCFTGPSGFDIGPSGFDKPKGLLQLHPVLKAEAAHRLSALSGGCLCQKEGR